MKKASRILIAVIALIVTMSIMVSAAAPAPVFTPLADELNEIGLFRGSGGGYALERAPTRLEAAVMLVRLLGQEQSAEDAYEAGTISHPFTDVPEWAGSSVAYLFTNGLANGVSTAEFGSNSKCSAQMYCTFMLRVLGYSDKNNGDFTYDNALDFAQQIGLVDSALLTDTFLRDHLVAITYQALATEVKDEDRNLLEKLIDSGAVDAAEAEGILEKIDNYENICAAYDSVNTAKSIDVTVITKQKFLFCGEETTIETTTSIKVNITANTVEAAIEHTSTSGITGQTQTHSEWLKDGWVYMISGQTLSRMAMSYDDMINAVREEIMRFGPYPFYHICDMTADSENGGASYHVNIFPEVFDLAELITQDGSFSGISSPPIPDDRHYLCDDVAEIVQLDESGKPTRFVLMAEIIKPDDTGETATVSYDMTINAIGKTVAIDFPNLSDFSYTIIAHS